MANEEQLKLLKQGVVAWNEWRQINPYVQPDLSQADLTGLDLTGADLYEVNCSDAIFTRSDLPGCNLHRSALIRADLREANLHGADLSFANLTRANLSKANLSGANLDRSLLFQSTLVESNLKNATLIRADLSSTDCTKADLSNASLTGADLVAANLEEVDLSNTFLDEANLSMANLRSANLTKAHLSRSDLTQANLSDTTLIQASLIHANLHDANFARSNLAQANLSNANLTYSRFSAANLDKADLRNAILVRTDLAEAILTDCAIFGISAWDIELLGTTQRDLVITDKGEPVVTVDNLKIAQFIYLLLNNAEIRDVIDTVSKKAVLILGRFTPERKVVLEAMANELRKHNLLPIIFDFEGATTRDVTETIKTLAGLSLFVIADITNPKSAPLELQATVPDYQIPFVAIIQQGERPFSMFSDLPKYPWVLTPVIEYSSVEKLLQGFKQGIIDRAWMKHQELVKQKNQSLETQSIEEFVREDEGSTGA